MPLWISFVLLAAGILAIYVEIFVPAAGLIGLAGGGMIVAGVVLGYVHHDPLTGSIVLVTALVVAPTALIMGLRAFPNTPMGKRLILGNSDEGQRDAAGEAGTPEASGRGAGEHTADDAGTTESVVAGHTGSPEQRAIAPGSSGVAITVLRPSGTAELAGRRMTVVTSGEFVEQGAPLIVMRVEGNRVVVRRDTNGSA